MCETGCVAGEKSVDTGVMTLPHADGVSFAFDELQSDASVSWNLRGRTNPLNSYQLLCWGRSSVPLITCVSVRRGCGSNPTDDAMFCNNYLIRCYQTRSTEQNVHRKSDIHSTFLEHSRFYVKPTLITVFKKPRVVSVLSQLNTFTSCFSKIQ